MIAEILRVGMAIPSSLPSAGGGYTLEHAVFQAACKRYYSATSERIRFIPIASSVDQLLAWNFDPAQCFLLPPALKRSTLDKIKGRILNFFHRASASSQPSLDALLRSSMDVLWSASPYTLSTKLPFIISVWDLQHRLQPFFPEVGYEDKWPWQVREDHYQSTARKAFACVVGTRRGGEELTRFYGIDPSRILVNPFPCPKALPSNTENDHDVLRRFELSPNQFLLYPAQFWRHKNHLCALKAQLILLNKGISLKLVLPGSDKGVANSIRGLIMDMGLAQHVLIPGFLSPEDLAALYRGCFALIFPSFFGPDNLPPLEAMSYGKPAVVGSVPGSKDQYQNSVLYFDPFSPADLAQQVESLFHSRAIYDELVQRGYKMISALSPEAYIENIVDYLISNQLLLACASL
jgi:glycosyltransferase involved in cell wall biosynthesis